MPPGHSPGGIELRYCDCSPEREWAMAVSGVCFLVAIAVALVLALVGGW